MRRSLLSLGSLLGVLLVVVFVVILLAPAPAVAAESPRGPTISAEIESLWNSVLGWLDVRPDAPQHESPVGNTYSASDVDDSGEHGPPDQRDTPPGSITPQAGPGLDPNG